MKKTTGICDTSPQTKKSRKKVSKIWIFFFYEYDLHNKNENY